MILTCSEIEKQVGKGNININPFDKQQLNPNSYNYRLDYTLLEIDSPIDSKQPCRYNTIYLDSNGYILQPNKLYLANTYEMIGSKKFVTQLIGRSSIGRLGLFLQITAPLGHIGTNHKWTLELKVVQPLKVFPLMKIGQVTFWKTKGKKASNYSYGEYKQYQLPQISKFFKEL